MLRNAMWRRFWNYCRCFLTGFGLLFAVVAFSPLTAWWTRLFSHPWYGPQGEVLVVLGGSVMDDVVGESSYLRSVYAVRAYRQAGYRKILLSGRGAAGPMRDFLVAHGVPADRIVLENKSTSTYENARESAALLRASGDAGAKIVLLTSDYHTHRSYLAFSKAGLPAATFPAPDALKRSNFPLKRWSAFQDLVLESVKYAYYRAKGWI